MDKNQDPTEPDAEVLNLLMLAATTAIDNGLEFARHDDPHRFAGLHREFDNGRAHRRLVIDYQAHGRVRIALELHGRQGGEPRVCEVFGTTLQGPAEGFELKQLN